MESIFGVPAHPFFVHAPLVLVPFVSTVAIAVAVRPVWRRRFGLWVPGATALIVVATLLAVSSGEAFDDLLGGTEPIDHHRQLGETSRIFVLALFVAVLGLVFAGRYHDRSKEAQAGRAWTAWLLVALAAITVGAAVSSTVWIVRTGHEGSKVVWRNVSIGDGTATAVPDQAPAVGVNATPTAGPISVTITDYALDASGRLLKAGPITFGVRNGENTTEHEFVIIKGKFLELPKTSNGAVDETKLEAGALLGRTAMIPPGTSVMTTFTLIPGSYVLLCNISVGPNSHARDGQRLDVMVE